VTLFVEGRARSARLWADKSIALKDRGWTGDPASGENRHSARSALCPLAGDFRYESWTRNDRKAKAVQFDDSRHQAQPQSPSWRAAALVGAIKASRHKVAFAHADAWAGVGDSYDSFIVAVG
jgi:hypothetical protein